MIAKIFFYLRFLKYWKGQSLNKSDRKKRKPLNKNKLNLPGEN